LGTLIRRFSGTIKVLLLRQAVQVDAAQTC